MSTVDIRRGGDRFVTQLSWLDSRHSFSYGRHYDPANTHFGVLVAANHDVVAAGAGFDPHPHRDVEIVSWVMAGALSHMDSAGHRGVARPGLVQRISAGGGIVHSERAGGDGPVEFVQMWVRSQPSGGEPDYRQADVSAALAKGGLVPIASGTAVQRETAALPLRQPHATLHAARLPEGEGVRLPAAPYLHLYVARGGIVLGGSGELAAGDAARIAAGAGPHVTATAPAEVLVWEMHASLCG